MKGIESGIDHSVEILRIEPIEEKFESTYSHEASDYTFEHVKELHHFYLARSLQLTRVSKHLGHLRHELVQIRAKVLNKVALKPEERQYTIEDAQLFDLTGALKDVRELTNVRCGKLTHDWNLRNVALTDIV